MIYYKNILIICLLSKSVSGMIEFCIETILNTGVNVWDFNIFVKFFDHFENEAIVSNVDFDQDTGGKGKSCLSQTS